MDAKDKNKCYNCGKNFKTHAHLTQHKNRKTPCLIRELSPEDEKNPNRCIYCNKILSKKENLTRHHNVCKIKNGGLQMLHDKVKYEETLRIMKEETALKDKFFEEKINELQAEINKLKTKTEVIVPQVINSNNNINIQNLTINNYNKPNVEYLTDLTAFAKLLNYELAGTPLALVDKIWYNSDHPENTSIHLVNKKTGETLVVADGKWTVKDAASLIPTLRYIVYDLTQTMIVKNPDKLINFANDMVPRFLEQNRKDELLIKRDAEEILKKMISGRPISQLQVEKHKQ